MDELTPGRSSVSPAPPPVLPQTFLERHGISPVLFAFLTLVGAFILYQIVGGLVTVVLFGIKPTADQIGGFRIATGLSQILLLLVPTLLIVRLASYNPKDFLRLRMPDFRTLLIPLVGIFSLDQVLQVYLHVQDKIPIPEPLRSKIQELKELIEEVYRQLVSSHTVPELLLVILVVALIPAISEEFLFRGLVQRSFENGLTPTKGVILTGIIFGVYHLNPFSIVPLVVLGTYLGFLVMRSQSLWVSVAAHFYNNLLASIAVFLNVKDDYVVTGEASSMSTAELASTFLFFTIVFLLSTWYFVRITKPLPAQIPPPVTA